MKEPAVEGRPAHGILKIADKLVANVLSLAPLGGIGAVRPNEIQTGIDDEGIKALDRGVVEQAVLESARTVRAAEEQPLGVLVCFVFLATGAALDTIAGINLDGVTAVRE